MLTDSQKEQAETFLQEKAVLIEKRTFNRAYYDMLTSNPKENKELLIVGKKLIENQTSQIILRSIANIAKRLGVKTQDIITHGSSKLSTKKQQAKIMNNIKKSRARDKESLFTVPVFGK